MHRRYFLAAATAISSASWCGSAWPANAHGVATGTIGGILRRLTIPGGGDNRATFTPDGKTLLFASSRSGKSQIWGIDPDGGRPRRIHESTANDFGRVAANADGTKLCFSSDRSGENIVYVFDITSGGVTPVSDPAFWSFGPTWSSRDLIAFFSKKGGNKINVWTVRPDGSQARQITNHKGESRQPWWSPDGGLLALSSDDATGKYQVQLVTPDGSNARTITHRGTWEQPFWSPDGKRIAVSAKVDEAHYRIYAMNKDGSNPRSIRQPEGRDNIHPAWSPDGRSIVFTSGKDADASLYLFSFPHA